MCVYLLAIYIYILDIHILHTCIHIHYLLRIFFLISLSKNLYDHSGVCLKLCTFVLNMHSVQTCG